MAFDAEWKCCLEVELELQRNHELNEFYHLQFQYPVFDYEACSVMEIDILNISDTLQHLWHARYSIENLACSSSALELLDLRFRYLTKSCFRKEQEAAHPHCSEHTLLFPNITLASYISL